MQLKVSSRERNGMAPKARVHRTLLSIGIGVMLAVSFVLPALLCASDTPAPASPAAATSNPAVIEFWNRDIATFRGTIAGAGPQERADRVVERLKDLPLYVRSRNVSLVPFVVEGQNGIAFMYDGRILFYLGTNDLDKESGETLAHASQGALLNLDEALKARTDERAWPVVRAALLFTFIGLVLLIVAASLVRGAHAILAGLVARRENAFQMRLQLLGVDLRPHIVGAIYGVLRLVKWALILIFVYAWLTLSLRRFPYTQPWGQKLGGYVLDLLQQLGSSAIHALPGILAVIIIFVITRWIVRLVGGLFGQVASGNIRTGWLDPDVARATQRIFAAIAWIFAVVVAYPYIPGSGTDAFKGISVFFGLVVSLGSTGIINQVMSGLFVVYSRALKTGDWVQINDTEGEVLEVGLLAGKVRTVEGQEVTIPNSVLVSTATKNFTRLGHLHGMIITCTITIGYDAPWRQVEALLLLAADRTHNVRKDPKPHVLQRELSDFYVAYTLIARLENDKLRVETLSALHGNIQDAFNEVGVQIMSPHFMMQPQDAVLVPPSKWHAYPSVSSPPDPTLPKAQHAAGDH